MIRLRWFRETKKQLEENIELLREARELVQILRDVGKRRFDTLLEISDIACTEEDHQKAIIAIMGLTLQHFEYESEREDEEARRWEHEKI